VSEGLNVIYAGTPDFAATALQRILQTDHKVIAVYTQPDRPAGRGRKLTASPVKQLALEHDIPVYQPASLKGEAEQAELAALGADVMVVAAYGLILPEPVLQIPRYGCLNIHASLLPRWRGAAPIQRAILAGDSETGVTIMQMDVGLDTGDMLSKVSCSIDAGDTGGMLHDKLAGIGADAIVDVLGQVREGTLLPVAQDDSQANYASKLSKAEAEIDWHQSADAINRLVHAFNPWPVAYTSIGNNKVLRIWGASVSEKTTTAEPGTVLSESREGIDVATGQGVLSLTQLQLPGKKPQSTQEFLNGHSLADMQLGS